MKLTRCCFVAVLALSGLWCGTASAIVTGEYLLDGTAEDTSGFDRDGTITGGSFTAGLYMGSTSALLQSANGQTVSLPASTDFIRNVPGATLMAWARPDGSVSTTQTILVVNNGDTTAGAGIGAARANIQIAGGQFRALGRQADTGGSSSAAGGTPLIGGTFFVAGVFEYASGAVRLYVNGQPTAATTGIASWNVNSADTANLVARTGSNADGITESWIGAIDGARIFNSALTATEILDIYNAETFPPPVPGDTDGDGVVEPEDLTPIRDNWRLTGKSRLQGNLSGDTAGLVDFADFRQWKTAILAGGGSLSGLDLGFVSVPEPSAAVLVLIGLLGLWRCRGTRRVE